MNKEVPLSYIFPCRHTKEVLVVDQLSIGFSTLKLSKGNFFYKPMTTLQTRQANIPLISEFFRSETNFNSSRCVIHLLQQTWSICVHLKTSARWKSQIWASRVNLYDLKVIFSVALQVTCCSLPVAIFITPDIHLFSEYNSPASTHGGLLFGFETLAVESWCESLSKATDLCPNYFQSWKCRLEMQIRSFGIWAISPTTS